MVPIRDTTVAQMTTTKQWRASVGLVLCPTQYASPVLYLTCFRPLSQIHAVTVRIAIASAFAHATVLVRPLGHGERTRDSYLALHRGAADEIHKSGVTDARKLHGPHSL